MIDIHCHMLFGVDDGPDDIDESVQMLIEAKNQGVDQIILTPHYREDMFSYPVDKILKNYKALCEKAEWFDVQLHLGTEYHVDGEMENNLAKKRCQTLAQSKYVLAEFHHSVEPSYLKNHVRSLTQNGYIPVVAHVERYECVDKDIDLISTLKKEGAWIQINAASVIGDAGSSAKKLCKKLLDNELVDVIASDAHGSNHRKFHMKECFQYVSKKYGDVYARTLMERNPWQIINS